MTLETPLHCSSIDQKLRSIDSAVHQALLGKVGAYPSEPGRDVAVVPVDQHPPKKGLSYKEGQARLLHDLASIEMQAMELAFRSLVDFPDADSEFRAALAELAISEAEHLGLCLRQIRELGFDWGSWPVHLGLWSATAQEDSLIDRLLIVHRYLEGSGLDAGETLLRRLAGVDSPTTKEVVHKIVHDEVGHVEFGSRWFRHFCEQQGLEPDLHFRQRLTELKHRLPKRLEPVSHSLRLKAGFNPSEIAFLEEQRAEQSKYPPRRTRESGFELS